MANRQENKLEPKVEGEASVDVQTVDKTPKTKASAPEDTRSKFAQAVDWAVDESIAHHGSICGICQWGPWKYTKKNQIRRSLLRHVRDRHRETIIDLFDKQVLSLASLLPVPSDAEDELLAVAGLSEVQDLDHYDRLAIPKSIRAKADVDGDVFRWVREDRVQHFTSQGADTVQLNGERGVVQPSTENNILRANEMVCVKMPHRLAENRRQQKESRLNESLNARAEEMAVKRDAYEGDVQDYLVKNRNLAPEQARRIAQSLSGRREREGGDPASNLGITVSDRHGMKSY